MVSSTQTNMTSSTLRVFGITKAGKPCKICCQTQRFCKRHRNQEPRQPSTPPEIRRTVRAPVPPPVSTSASSAVRRNAASQVEFCAPCNRMGKDCVDDVCKKNPNHVVGITTHGEVQHGRERESHRTTTTKIYGRTREGNPCKICLIKGDFCKKHVAQRQSGATTVTQERSSSPQPVIVYGTTVKGNPCTICISQGNFCSWHQKQRKRATLSKERVQATSTGPKPLGITVAGKPCKICIHESDYCYFHVDQKPVEAIATIEVTPPSTHFAIAKQDTPCELCTRQGDFCHMHAAQTKDNPTLAAISRMRRFLSLVFLGVIFQYVVFVGLLEGRSMEMGTFCYKISVDSIIEKGAHTYQTFGLDTIPERGRELKDAVIKRDWVDQVRSLTLVQSLMNTLHGKRVIFDHEHYQRELMKFVQSNATSRLCAHGSRSNVELTVN